MNHEIHVPIINLKFSVFHSTLSGHPDFPNEKIDFLFKIQILSN